MSIKNIFKSAAKAAVGIGAVKAGTALFGPTVGPQIVLPTQTAAPLTAPLTKSLIIYPPIYQLINQNQIYLSSDT